MRREIWWADKEVLLQLHSLLYTMNACEGSGGARR